MRYVRTAHCGQPLGPGLPFPGTYALLCSVWHPGCLHAVIRRAGGAVVTITSACRAVCGRVLALYAACRPEVLRLHSSFTLHRVSSGADACTASVAYSGWYFATLDRERTGPAQRGRVLESVCQFCMLPHPSVVPGCVQRTASRLTRSAKRCGHSVPRAQGVVVLSEGGAFITRSQCLFRDIFGLLLHECPVCPFSFESALPCVFMEAILAYSSRLNIDFKVAGWREKTCLHLPPTFGKAGSLYPCAVARISYH